MVTHNLTDAELRETLRILDEHGGNVSKAARAIGMNRNTFLSRVEAARVRTISLGNQKSPEALLETAKTEVRKLKAALAEVHRYNDTAEDIRRIIYDLADHSPEPPKWLNSAAKFNGTAGCPMTIWSDWHYGEVVNPDEVGGLNKFNSEIAQERIRKLVDRTIRLVRGFAFKEKGKEAKFPGIVVCLGGDMISGDIHEELADTNDRKPLECVNELLDLLISALTKLADEFGAVFVPCVVGNHGRTTRKPRMKGRVFTSYEWNLYTSLERHFRNDPRVSFFIPGETDAYFTVLGHGFLLTHGDSLGVKGGDGIIGAIGPIMRGIMKTLRGYAELGKAITAVVMGHWHQELWFPNGIVNNSLKGFDEYARLALRAPYNRPGQNLWFVHEEQGITSRMQVYVDDAKKAKKAPDWVIVPAKETWRA